MEVVRQEAQERPGQQSAQHGDDRLDGCGEERVDAEGRHRDQRDPRQQPVQAVDEVDAVEHAHDPDRRRGHGRSVGDGPERFGQAVDQHTARERDTGEDELGDELPARLEL